MYFETETAPHHTGTEHYDVMFQIREQGDLYDTQGCHVQFVFRPQYVVLVWERHRKGGSFVPWRRRRYRLGGGSKIAGGRVLKDGTTSDKQEGYQEVFFSFELGGPLTDYALSLPHLEQMIAELEKNLPA